MHLRAWTRKLEWEITLNTTVVLQRYWKGSAGKYDPLKINFDSNYVNTQEITCETFKAWVTVKEGNIFYFAT